MDTVLSEVHVHRHMGGIIHHPGYVDIPATAVCVSRKRFHSRLLLSSAASASGITRSGHFRDSNRVIR